MKKQKKVSIFKLTFFCLITTIIIAEITMACYETTFGKNDDSTIAVMADDVSLDVLIPSDIYPGSDPVVVPVVITNEENGKVCDVAQNYSMKIERTNAVNIPFEFVFCKDESCAEILELSADGYYHDSSFNFEAGKKEQKKYYVKIYWPEEYNDSSYAFEVDYFKILIDATQID